MLTCDEELLSSTTEWESSEEEKKTTRKTRRPLKRANERIKTLKNRLAAVEKNHAKAWHRMNEDLNQTKKLLEVFSHENDLLASYAESRKYCWDYKRVADNALARLKEARKLNRKMLYPIVAKPYEGPVIDGVCGYCQEDMKDCESFFGELNCCKAFIHMKCYHKYINQKETFDENEMIYRHQSGVPCIYCKNLSFTVSRIYQYIGKNE